MIDKVCENCQHFINIHQWLRNGLCPITNKLKSTWEKTILDFEPFSEKNENNDCEDYREKFCMPMRTNFPHGLLEQLKKLKE